MKNNDENEEHLRSAWRIYLLEYEMAKNYDMPYKLTSIGPTPNNPILDKLLPSLLFMRAMSILDESFKIELDNRKMQIAKNCKNNLNGRIITLSNEKIITCSENLHDLREQRNKLAHEDSSVDWNELSSAVDLVGKTLQELNLVGVRPSFECFAVQGKMENSPNPKIIGTQKFECFINENGKRAIEFSWSIDI